MIYTVTYNPSLDYIMRLPSLDAGETNRSESETLCPGGKGVNVALVLKGMGMDCRAAVFTAGFVGDEIERRLTESGLDCDFIRIPGNNRINVKLKADKETEINGKGAPAPHSATDALINKLSVLGDGDWLDLSGNTAVGTASDTYARIITSLRRGVRVVVDAHGELLLSTLQFEPFLVKPNLDELGGLFGKRLSAEDVPFYAQKLRHMGAANVIVSLGGDGAVMATESGLFSALPPLGTAVNSTGAGDSLVAAFITACEEGKSPTEAFRFAVAAGSACAYGESLAERADTEKLLDGVVVKQI